MGAERERSSLLVRCLPPSQLVVDKANSRNQVPVGIEAPSDIFKNIVFSLHLVSEGSL